MVSNSIPNRTTFVKKVFDLMLGLEGDCSATNSLTFPFYKSFSNSIPNQTAFEKKCSDLMLSLESDEVTLI